MGTDKLENVFYAYNAEKLHFLMQLGENSLLIIIQYTEGFGNIYVKYKRGANQIALFMIIFV